jgi:hypothetical protein
MKENDETSTIVSEEKISKQNEQKKEEPQTRKLPTIEEIQKRKKVLVHILLVLVFIGVMYWIFAPSKAEKEKLQTEQGINVEIPEISGGELPEDKGTAYKLAENEQKENERQWTMGTLSDFFVDTKIQIIVPVKATKLAGRHRLTVISGTRSAISTKRTPKWKSCNNKLMIYRHSWMIKTD